LELDDYFQLKNINLSIELILFIKNNNLKNKGGYEVLRLKFQTLPHFFVRSIINQDFERS